MQPQDDVESPFDRAPTALRLLGPMHFVAAGRRVALPRSKKTRALLAYLAVTGRPHRRERLCALFWDVTDDPRGALRWSLSRLRQVLPDDVERIVADREEVALSSAGLRIDACELAAAHRHGFAHLDIGALERLVPLYRGEFLEGLELPDFLDFTAWCIAERDGLRRAHSDLLAELVSRLGNEPTRALAHARQRAQIDVFNLAAQQDLLRLLLALGQIEEAERRFEHTGRLLRQVSAPDASALDTSWQRLKGQAQATRASSVAPTFAPRSDIAPAPLDGSARPFVGRRDVTASLESLLDEARQSGGTQVALVTGEPGVGKSRLAERLAALAGGRGVEVRVGRAYEAESSRPFGPWADALAIDVQQLATSNATASRDALFDRLRASLIDIATTGQGLLLVLDDLQWFDRSSAELLHYVVRTFDRGALLVLLLARSGELMDNEDVVLLLRTLRRTPTFRRVELAPLSFEEIQALVATVPGTDANRVHEVSHGNPLYALELMRAARDGTAGIPPTLVELVRERIERLPETAADVLRWGAVLGHAFDFAQIEGLVAQPTSALVEALERLEQHALLRIDATKTRERYVFAHDLIREAVYSELSQPRRRLMHRKVAQLLEPMAADAACVAADVAHHASLAGEALLGVRACAAAGHHALRLFANADAEALAKRGLQLAETLDEPARVEASLDLLHVLYSARAPDREDAACRVRGLAERALDLGLTHAARQGFQMLSFLRWEGSSLADAHANILQAERVSRAAVGGERATALAFAARCLVLLERNLQQAEAFVMEADAVAKREGKASAAVAFAIGMIAAHRGDIAVAVESFQEAADLARQQGEHLAEFAALEHHVMLLLDEGHAERAAALAEPLVELGGRVRPGAERLNACALLALAHLQAGASDDGSALRAAVDDVRRADAKYELSYVLSRWAELALAQPRLDEAAMVGTEALAVATAMGRRSEMALARAVLAEVADRRRRHEEREEHLAALRALDVADLSAHAQARLRALEERSAEDRGQSGSARRAQLRPRSGR